MSLLAQPRSPRHRPRAPAKRPSRIDDSPWPSRRWRAAHATTSTRSASNTPPKAKGPMRTKLDGCASASTPWALRRRPPAPAPPRSPNQSRTPRPRAPAPSKAPAKRRQARRRGPAKRRTQRRCRNASRLRRAPAGQGRGRLDDVLRRFGRRRQGEQQARVITVGISDELAGCGNPAGRQPRRGHRFRSTPPRA